MKSIISASFVCGDGFELVKTRHKSREHVPAYDRIGGNMEYRSPVHGYEGLYEVIGGLPKKANWFFWLLISNRNSTTNIAVYKAKSAIESKNITIAYKELKRLELVKRVSKQHYMINPQAMIPKPGRYDEALEIWEAAS